MATLIARESPVVLFFVYVVSLAIKFHGREIIMLDYTVTFDHWWYFYDRLRAGELAQWNPFSLLGRMAVQWSYLPVSIFSPLLVLSELTPERFHALNVASTVLILGSIYVAGRVAGYGRYLPLLPVVLVAASGFRYWMSFLHFATFLTVYPIAMAWLVSMVNSGRRPGLREWGALAALLAVSFLGLRLELMVYVVSFLVLLFVILGCAAAPRERPAWLAGLGVVAVAVTSSGWQLAFLVNSTLDSPRLSLGVDIGRFADGRFLKWLLLSVAVEPGLLLAAANLGLYALCRLRPRLAARGMSAFSLGLLLGGELLLVVMLKRILRLAAPSLKDVVSANFGLPFTAAGVAAIVVAGLVFLRREPALTLRRSLLFLTVLFAGFHASTYTGHTWPVNTNIHPYFVPLPLTGLLALGAVSLWLKGRGWIVVVLAAYHAVGEIGSLILFAVFGVPWLPPRATFAELPFQIVLMLEAMKFLLGAMALITGERSERWTRPIAQAMCVLIAFVAIKPALLPMERVREADRVHRPRQLWRYVQDFPFGPTAPEAIGTTGTQWVREALEASAALRERRGSLNPLTRAAVPDTVLMFAFEQYYKFVPAYSRTLNTTPLYSSEIPATLKQIFENRPAAGVPIPAERPPHPEMTAIVRAYSGFDLQQMGQAWLRSVLVFPHRDPDPIFRELLAEEGGHTPRAFLSSTVVRLPDTPAELRYLSGVLSRGGRLTDQITTSDPAFPAGAAGSRGQVIGGVVFRRDDPERIILEVSADRPAYLALLDLWSRGWRARVDGWETPIYRAYAGTRFVTMPTGRHTVEFAYRVPGLVPAAWLSGLVWVLTLGALASSRFFTTRIRDK